MSSYKSFYSLLLPDRTRSAEDGAFPAPVWNQVDGNGFFGLLRGTVGLVLCVIVSVAPLLAQEDTTTEPTAPKQKLVNVSGAIHAYAGVYKADGIPERNQATPFGLSGAVTISLPGGISLPFSAVLGNQGSSFRQPFNQFGLSPTYKWATVHAGYRNVQFSPFTLAGHTFLGGGVELNPGKFRLGAMYGRFNKAIASTLAEPDVIPAYQRTGYALKLGYGKSDNYVDLVMLRASDDSSSIGDVPPTTTQTVTPAENLVLGLSSRLLLVKHITVELDAAVSAYTRDVRSTVVSAEGSNPVARLFGRLITPRLSTQLTRATQAALGYRTKNAGIKLQYKRIDPNFQTMGAYYFQSDIESYAVAPNLTLLEGKLRLSGSYGIQYDNLAVKGFVRRHTSMVLANYRTGYSKQGWQKMTTIFHMPHPLHGPSRFWAYPNP